jgi:hypothetical protein
MWLKQKASAFRDFSSLTKVTQGTAQTKQLLSLVLRDITQFLLAFSLSGQESRHGLESQFTGGPTPQQSLPIADAWVLT